LGLGTPHNRRRARVAPTCIKKGRERMNSLNKTNIIHKQRMTMRRRRKTRGSGVSYIRSPGITHFIIDSGSQKNLISAEVVKRLALLTTPHP
jgi:hypothetical protein